MIRLSWNRQGLRVSTGQPLLAAAPLIEAQRAVNAMDPFVVPRVPPASQDFEQLAEAIGGISLGGLLQPRNHLVVPVRIRPISINRITDANDTTGSALAQLVNRSGVINQFSSHRWL